jgi:tetratricopeptide (TPR) repeat protein
MAVASQARQAAAPAQSPAGRERAWLPTLALVAMVVVAYLPALKNGFIWDDDLMLTENPLIKSATGIFDFWFSTKPTDYFPLTYTDLWVEWRLWGMNATGYHLTNVLLHAVNALLLWRVLLAVVGVRGNGQFGAAWFGAALFAVHPVNVATVAWIAERKNTLALAFALCSVLAYCKWEEPKSEIRSPKLYFVALGCFVLSLFSKTAGVGLPIVLLGIAWRKGNLARREIVRTMPFFAVAFVMGLATIWFQNHHALSADFPDRDLATKVAGVGMAIWFYVWKALLPIGLIPVYRQWTINAHVVTVYIPDVCLVGAMALLLVQNKRWGRTPLFVFGGFILMLLPVTGLLNVNYHQFSLVADHWQYFAIPFMTTFVAYGAWKWAPGSAAMILGGAVLACAILTWQQAKIYDKETLWRTTLAKNPRCWIACNNLGQGLEDRSQFDDALTYFKRSLEYHPGYRNALMGVASTYLRMNKTQQAIEPLTDLVRQQPNNVAVRYNLGTAYLDAGRAQQAEEQFEAAVQIPEDEAIMGKEWRMPGALNDPKMLRAEIRNRLGAAQAAIGKKDEALKSLLASLAENPESGSANYRVATLLTEKHDRAGARKYLREALRVKPDAIEAQNDLAWNLATDANATAEEKAEAKRLALAVAEVTKESEPGALDTLAVAYAAEGEFEYAMQYTKKAEEQAVAKGDKNLAAELQKRAQIYSERRAYTE